MVGCLLTLVVGLSVTVGFVVGFSGGFQVVVCAGWWFVSLFRVWALIDVFRIGGFGGVVLRGLVWVLMVVGSGAV